MFVSLISAIFSFLGFGLARLEPYQVYYIVGMEQEEQHIDFRTQECSTQQHRSCARLGRLSYPLPGQHERWYSWATRTLV